MYFFKKIVYYEILQRYVLEQASRLPEVNADLTSLAAYFMRLKKF